MTFTVVWAPAAEKELAAIWLTAKDHDRITAMASVVEGLLRHEITQKQLVTWAEEAIQEGDFPDAEAPELAQVVGRLGLADVKEFELA